MYYKLTYFNNFYILYKIFLKSSYFWLIYVFRSPVKPYPKREKPWTKRGGRETGLRYSGFQALELSRSWFPTPLLTCCTLSLCGSRQYSLFVNRVANCGRRKVGVGAFNAIVAWLSSVLWLCFVPIRLIAASWQVGARREGILCSKISDFARRRAFNPRMPRGSLFTDGQADSRIRQLGGDLDRVYLYSGYI